MKKTRLVARQIARELSFDEINMVAGGHPGPTATGTDCHKLDGGALCCGDHEHDKDSGAAQSFGGGF